MLTKSRHWVDQKGRIAAFEQKRFGSEHNRETNQSVHMLFEGERCRGAGYVRTTRFPWFFDDLPQLALLAYEGAIVTDVSSAFSFYLRLRWVKRLQR